MPATPIYPLPSAAAADPADVPVDMQELADRIETVFKAPAWIEITAFLGTWTNFGGAEETAAYRKDANGVVRLKGTIKSGTVGTNAFNLPVGYRPAGPKRFASAAAGAYAQINVAIDGNVSVAAGATSDVSLAGVSFPV